jgi:hypothetical protein
VLFLGAALHIPRSGHFLRLNKYEKLKIWERGEKIMKKRRLIILLGLFLFCISGTVFAADTATSSSSDTTAELKAELHDLQLRIKALEAQKAELDKKNQSDLNQSELGNLGDRVNTLEKKSDQLTFNGFLHLSDQVWSNSGVFKNSTALDTPHPANDGSYPALGIDMYLSYKVNDSWQLKVENEICRDFRTGGYWSANADGFVGASQRDDQIYAQGKIGVTAVKAGKFDYSPAYGMVIAAGRKALDGVQFDFGDKYKTTLAYGYIRQTWTGNALNPLIISGNTDNHYASIAFAAQLSPDSNFKAAYHNIKNDGSDSTVFSDNINIWEVGADKMIAKDLDLWATYARSNAENKNSAYMAGLTYGNYNPSVPNSWTITGRYLKAEGYATICPDNYWVSAYGVSGVAEHGLKGPEINFMYMFDKNVGMMAWLADLSTTDGTAGRLKTAKVEMDFFF